MDPQEDDLITLCTNWDCLAQGLWTQRLLHSATQELTIPEANQEAPVTITVLAGVPGSRVRTVASSIQNLARSDIRWMLVR